MNKFSEDDLRFFARALGALEATFRKAEFSKATLNKVPPKSPVVEGPAPMDLVLVSMGSDCVGMGSDCVRERAIVEEVTVNSVLLKLKGQEPTWYSSIVVKDILGQADDDELLEFGYEIPEKVKLTTGAYVVCVTMNDERQLHMIEVDRVGSQYIWRFVGDNKTRNMTDDTASILMRFSDPDDLNDMVAEPGIYYIPVAGTTIEVIPFEGVSLFRYINSSRLFELSDAMSKDIMPIESDTLDINAVAIIPENLKTVAPENLDAASIV